MTVQKRYIFYYVYNFAKKIQKLRNGDSPNGKSLMIRKEIIRRELILQIILKKFKDELKHCNSVIYFIGIPVFDVFITFLHILNVFLVKRI